MDAWESIALTSGNDPAVVPTFGSALSEWVLPYNIYPQTMFGFNLMNQSVCTLLGHPLALLTLLRRPTTS